MAQQRWCEEDDVRRDRRPFRPRRHESPGHDEARVATAPASATGVRFVVPRAQELLRQERVTLSQPKEIAYFSKYADGDVRFDRSKLLAYKEAEIGANLLDGIESYTPQDEAKSTVPPAPIAPLLAALEHFQGRSGNVDRPHFVTYRNNLNKIMGTPYNSNSEWTLELEKRSGCVYLDVRRTQQDIESNRNPHENQRRGAFAGRRFEIYSTRDNQIASDDQEVGGDTDNTGKGKTNRQVNEDEEFCSISAMTLGGKRLVVAAEIDCYDDDGEADTAANKYVELKTFRLLQRQKDQFVFERFKLLAFWIQSYLVGTPRIVCAFRNDSFEVRKLQTFRTTDIPGFCHRHWSPAVCLGFTKALLDWIYENAAEDGRTYRVTYFPRQHAVEMSASSTTPDTPFLPATLR